VNARAGFALPLVLAAIAMVSLSLLTLSRAAGGGVRRAEALDAQWAAHLSALSAEARVAHLLAIRPLGVRAILVEAEGRMQDREVILDGRPYKVPGTSAIVAIQDEAGLVNLNDPEERITAELLRLAGAPQSRDLAARLADFVDADDARRLSGAESADYLRSGEPVPPNAALRDVRQSFAVLGWSALPDDAMRLVRENGAALSPGAWLNPNTATEVALRAALGIDAKAAAKVIAQREAGLLLTREEVLALAGGPDSPVRVRASPGRSFALSVWIAAGSSQESYVYASRLRIAEEGSQRPVESAPVGAPRREPLREWTRNHVFGEPASFPAAEDLRAP
jgi:type II secretory pathway component PulK